MDLVSNLTVATQRAIVMTMTLKRPQQSARKPGRTRPATEAALRYERRTYEAVGSWPWAPAYKMRKVSEMRRPSSMKMMPAEAKAKRRSRKMVKSGLAERVASCEGEMRVRRNTSQLTYSTTDYMGFTSSLYLVEHLIPFEDWDTVNSTSTKIVTHVPYDPLPPVDPEFDIAAHMWLKDNNSLGPFSFGAGVPTHIS